MPRLTSTGHERFRLLRFALLACVHEGFPRLGKVTHIVHCRAVITAFQWTGIQRSKAAAAGGGGVQAWVGYAATHLPRHRACLGGSAPVPSRRTSFFTSPSSVMGTASAGGCLCTSSAMLYDSEMH